MKSMLALAVSLLASPSFAGQLTIPGTGDGMDILAALAQSYRQGHPDDLIMVPPSIGSGGAIAAVNADREVLGRVARDLTPTERDQGLATTPFARIPSVFYVNPAAGVSNLSSEQISGIFAGTIRNWSEVGGRDLKIRVVRREDGDSTLNVLRSTMPGWKSLVITDRSKTAVTTQESLRSVGDTDGAIGFGPFTTSLGNEVLVLTVDGRRPHDPDYPSATTVALIHKASTVTPDARAFIAYATSNEARAIIQSFGASPMGRQ